MQEGSTGIIIGRWQPQKNTIYPRSRSSAPQLSEQERRKQLLPSLEIEEPASSGTLDVALAQAGNLAVGFRLSNLVLTMCLSFGAIICHFVWHI